MLFRVRERRRGTPDEVDVPDGMSIGVGKTFSISFRVHVMFLLLIVFVSGSRPPQRGLGAGMIAVLFICAVFPCVQIHGVEQGQMARRFGKEAKRV